MKCQLTKLKSKPTVKLENIRGITRFHINKENIISRDPVAPAYPGSEERLC